MNFAAPALLWGLLFATVPIAVHLIGRKRAPTVSFSAYDYLAEVVQRLARREQLRQLLLLLLRVLAVILLVVALAGPGVRAAVVAADRPDTLVVIDASASMVYDHRGRSLLERAKDRAARVLDQRSDGLALVVVAGDEVTPLAVAPTADRAALKDALGSVRLSKARLSTKPADLAGAVRRGLELFADRAAEVFVISDLAANAFAGSDVFAGTQARALKLLDAAERPTPVTALPNVAIGLVTVEPLLDKNYRVVAQLKNFGAEPATAEVRVSVDGVPRARGFAELPSGASIEREFTLSDLSLGLHSGEVALVGAADGLVFDDGAPLVVEAFADPKVLVVNGDPRSLSYKDELFYLEKALQVAEPPIAFDVSVAEDLATADLDQARVVVLANMPAPNPSVAAMLADFVAGGGGLLIGLGDRVEFEKYNEALAAVLPARLRDQWSVGDPKAADALANALGLTDVAWEHPIFRKLAGSSEPAFSQSHTFRHFFVEAGDLSRTKQLMRFTSGAPALIEGAPKSGKGRVVLWLSTLDRDFSDLAIRPSFAPLMHQTLRYLGGSLRTAPERALVAGVAAEMPLPVGASQAWIRGLDGGGEAVALNANALVKIDKPGLYALHASSQSQELIAGTAFAVLPSLDESDYTPVNTAELARRWGAPETTLVAGEGERSQSPWDGQWTGYAHLLLVGLLLAFSLEAFFARKG